MAGLLCMSQATARRVWLPNGDTLLFPNLYALLVGPQALSRKSTTLGLVGRMVGRAFPDELVPDDWTPEALVDALSDVPRRMWICDELSALFQGERREYRTGTSQMLASLYQCPDRYEHVRRDRRRSALATGVFPNIAAATTQSWFTESVRDGALGGGLLSRFAYIVYSDSGRLFPRRPAHDEDLAQALCERLRALRAGLGDGRQLGDEPVLRAYEAFYVQSRSWAKADLGTDDILGGFYARVAEMALKFAQLYQLSYDPASTELSSHAWTHAEALASHLRATARAVVSELEQSTGDKLKSRILEVVKRGNGEPVLLKHISSQVGAKLGDARARKTAIEELMAEGRIARVPRPERRQGEAYAHIDED
jgi:hypothetical protein